MYPHHISCPDYHCVCPPWAPYGRAQDPTYIPLQRTGNKAAQSAVLLLCARANGDPPFVRIGFTSFASSQPSNNLRPAARLLVSDWDTGTQGMEPLEPESPRVEQVGGILSRGEDTDGERTDDEVDFPSEPSPSYVSQYDAEQGGDVQQDELEVTGEGTAGGPFGLKKVLFVRKKSEKGLGSKEEPSLKDRFSKLGAGVGERFAAFGNIIHEHGSRNTAVSGAASKVAENFLAADEKVVNSQVPPQGASAAASAAAASAPSDPPQQLAMEYFQEYEMTFSSEPTFSLVEGVGGKGAVVSWDSSGDAAAVNGGGAGAAPAAVSIGSAGTSKASSVPGSKVPQSGAVVIAVAGKPVVDSSLSEVVALLRAGGSGSGGGDNDGNGSRGEQSKATASKDTEEPGKLSIEVPPDSAGGGGGGGGAYSLVVRFREKTGSGGVRQQETGVAGGEVFRNKMKAMATGLGSFFQVKETGGSVVRDGSVSGGDAGGAAGAATSDSFVLTFSAANRTAEELPFTMAEVVGGLGVIVAAVRDDYAESLVRSEQTGVVSAGTAGVAAAAAAATATGDEGVSGEGAADGGAGVLEPGALLLRVAGQNVEGKGLQRVRKVVEAVAAEHSAVKLLFRNAPPIYRASVAAELALEQSKAPQIHVGTWQPLLKRRAGVTLGGGGGGSGSGHGENGDGGGGGGAVIGLGYGGEEWEDVQTTMARAHRFVNGFRSVGIRVDILSMQTVTLPRNVKSAYASTFEGRPSSFQQAVRLWFSFPDERTVSLQRQPTLEKLGLLHVDTRGVGTIGSWVTVVAADASPCADAGIPVLENSILTHVNGFDVSPAAYRSLAPLPFGEGQGWAAAVLPALESGGGDTITLTFV
ncbi:unnamed protein product [Pylaiella littoralis]